MTNTMTMEEQIEMSGLEITPLSQLQWNSTNQWSPLLGGGQESQACMTIKSGSGENGAGGQTIVLIGGGRQSGEYTNSVIVWDPSTKRWRNGPNLNDRRIDLVAVVCRDKVYAIGGSGDDNYNSYTTLDTIESIQVSSPVETMETSMTRQNNSQWTRLQCHLSSPRQPGAAVVIHNRYIVILGGVNGMGEDLSSVDIMDIGPHNNNNGEPTIVAIPSMNSTRDGCGAVVMDNCILVVGGYVNGRQSTLVESLLFQQHPQDKDHTYNTSNVSCTFPNSSWRVEPHLTLSTGRVFHALYKVGSCFVVARGFCINHGRRTYPSVEVMDVQWGIVWSLPNLTIERPFGCSMITFCLIAFLYWEDILWRILWNH